VIRGPYLDYGEQLVKRYRASGLTRKEFAERSGISVSTLAYYVRRERKVRFGARHRVALAEARAQVLAVVDPGLRSRCSLRLGAILWEAPCRALRIALLASVFESEWGRLGIAGFSGGWRSL
jgi:transcriptional regulator with XRE-family HTH domain